MAIKEVAILVRYNPSSAKHYEEKGYIFPTSIDKQNRIVVKKGTEILVKVEDLPKGSKYLVTKICDICGCEVSKPQTYDTIMQQRKRNKDGLDKCAKCSITRLGKLKGIVDESNCIANTHPEFAKLFWDEKVPFIRSYASHKKADFKCPQCGGKVENKTIAKVFERGVSCYCSDGKSYPEKFMYSFLNQLNVDFKTEKTFSWSKYVNSDDNVLNGKKTYDFYLNELKMIIETHGIQHYERSNREARTLEEEQENDRIKELLAKENGIIHYIIVDCRLSEMEYIKTSILKSELNKLFDTTKIDWLKCHEFACSSLVKKACDLWNEGKSIKMIAEMIKVDRNTISNYLKKGKAAKLCDYNIKESRERRDFNIGEHSSKPIIQLSLNGEFIREWESSTEASRVLGKGFSAIDQACRGKKAKSRGGFLWMFKEDYHSKNSLNEKIIYEKKSKSIPIIQLSLDGEFIREWESIKEANKMVGKNIGINHVLTGKRKTAGGFIWMYKADYSPIKGLEKAKTIDNLKNYKSIIQLSLDGVYIDEWGSFRKASEKLGINRKSLSAVCNGREKTAGGFKWMFKEDYEKIVKNNI